MTGSIFQNGVTNEAIVLQWLVRTALWDFKVVKKQWAGALLSVKCCCFVRKSFEWVTQFWTSPSKEEEEEEKEENWFWVFGDFLVQVYCFWDFERYYTNIARYCVGYQDLLLPEECNIPQGRRPSGILHSKGSNKPDIQHSSVQYLFYYIIQNFRFVSNTVYTAALYITAQIKRAYIHHSQLLLMILTLQL